MCRNETISGFGVPHTLGDFRFPSCLTLGLSPQGSQSRGHRAGRPMQAVSLPLCSCVNHPSRGGGGGGSAGTQELLLPGGPHPLWGSYSFSMSPDTQGTILLFTNPGPLPRSVVCSVQLAITVCLEVCACCLVVRESNSGHLRHKHPEL
jgi:hypothetical protein